MIRIFRDKHNDSSFVVQSTCTDAESFLMEFAEAVSTLARQEDDYSVFQVFRVAMPIAFKLSGYKADNVREQRTLVCGDVSPENCNVISQAGR